MVKTTLLTGLSFVIGMVCANLLDSVLSAQTRAVKSTELLRVDLGSWCEGKEATVELNEIGAGASARHYHPAHSFEWIIEGSELHTVQGEPPITVRAGEVIHEEPMQVNEAQGSAPIKKLAFRIIEKGKPTTTRVQ